MGCSMKTYESLLRSRAREKSFAYKLGLLIDSLKKKFKARLDLRSQKVKDIYDTDRWQRASTSIKRGGKEDLSVSGYIDKHGGIESNIDGKMYSSEASYMDHIKASGKVIKDW